MFRGYLSRISHLFQSMDLSFNVFVVVLCVGAGFGIAVISSVLQGDPIQRSVKKAVEIPGVGVLPLEQGELATQAFQYMSAAGNPDKQEEIKENLKTQYSQMDEKNKAQLKRYLKTKYPDKIEELKKRAKAEGL